MKEPPGLQTGPESSNKANFRALRTAFLMAGSAFLGGLAVVLLHRKSLASLRQPTSESNRPPKRPDAETE